jgi:hypothetical protein
MTDGDERDRRVRAHIRQLFGLELPPTDPYIGLTLAQAVELAEKEGRRVVDRSPNFRSRRADLVPGRVNVLLNVDGVVVQADVG